MPRRRPAQLRLRELYPGARSRPSRIPGLSSRSLSSIASLERSRLGRGHLELRFNEWAAVAQGRARHPDPWDWYLYGLLDADCPCLDCGGRPNQGRPGLVEAIAQLPPRAARELRAAVKKLDDRYLARARRNANLPTDLPWW